MFKTDLAYENWATKYRYQNETPIETFQRVAKALASVEKDNNYWYDKFLSTLVRINPETNEPIGLKSTTGGRITANIGTAFKNATLINCYISGAVSGAKISYSRKSYDGSIEYPITIKSDDSPDDLVNIFLTITEQAKTLASEGGYGINFDFIRPRGALIKGTGIKHPGVVSYMKIWDAVAECIVKGDNDGYLDKIRNYLKDEEEVQKVIEITKKQTRKGAMMGCLSCSHPDVEEFIRAKQKSGVLTKFNMSVAVDDEFMEAVKKDKYYNLHFNGVIYKKIKARDLYDLMMESSYNRAEPGILFVGNMHRNNPISYLGKCKTTNPCVKKGTLVSTKKGLVPVEEVKEGDEIQTTCGFDKVLKKEKYKNISLYKVTFDDGSYLSTSEGHIFHTINPNIKNKVKWDDETRLLDLDLDPKFFVRKIPYNYEPKERKDLTRILGYLAGAYMASGSTLELSTKIKGGILPEVFFRRIGVKPDNRVKNLPYWWANTNKKFIAGIIDGILTKKGELTITKNKVRLVIKDMPLDFHLWLRHLLLLAHVEYTKWYEDTWEIGISSLYNLRKYIDKLSDSEKDNQIKNLIKTCNYSSKKWKTRIESIEKDGTGDVYDLYCETDDWNTCGIVNRGCGEIPGLDTLTTICLLGSINLTQYIMIKEDKSRYFDKKQYEEDIKVLTRMLDNVNDLVKNAIPSYDWATKNLRQIGMGINGLGSALMMLGIKYNSKEAIDLVTYLCQTKEDLTWQTSALLAEEKGAFPAYDKKKFEKTEYFKSDRISSKTKRMLRKYGARNAKTTTNPPLGNSSVICDMVSNAIEPAPFLEYDRKKICPSWPDGLNEENIRTVLVHYKEKDYEYWQGEYNGKTYYYEPHNRGLCTVTTVRDFGYQWLLDNFPEEDHSSYLITTKDLDIQDHLNIQKVVQYYCNQSVSKTCSLPNDYPMKSFKKLYLKAWELGLNGFTTYREGSMESVISAIEKAEQSKEIISKDIKLPEVFENGPTKIIKREGMKFYMHFSYLPEDSTRTFPVALWIYTNDRTKDNSKVCNKASRNLAKLAYDCGINSEIIEAALTKAKIDYPHNRLGRMVSLCLRHNIPREDVLVSLMGIDGDNISTMLTAVRKFLGETIKDGTALKGASCIKCGSNNIKLEAGCKKCYDCMYSGCGD